MDEQQQPRWRPTRRQLLWAGVAAALLLLIVAVLVGYRYDVTLWDWLKLLIIPAVIAGGGLWFNAQQRKREEQIANERAQDEALQAYLDQMSQLLPDKDRPLHRAQVGDSLSTVARARTLTVLAKLDGERKWSVVQFLYESGLINRARLITELAGADVRGANLRGIWLKGADLSRAFLNEADLNSAMLEGTNLRRANLSRAGLMDAYLNHANLSRAELSSADLRRATLREANLSGAEGITNQQLDQQAFSLEGATMPNGQKYEDWLKDRENRKEDAENGSPS